MRFRNGQQVLLFFVLVEQFHEVCECAVGEKYFTLAVDDIFLQVERNGLRVAKIFHAFGNGDARLFADAEKTVDRGATGKDHGRMVEDLDPLAAKLLEGNPLDLDEGMKLDIEVVFRNDLVVGGLFDCCRSRLRHQDAFNLQNV